MIRAETPKPTKFDFDFDPDFDIDVTPSPLGLCFTQLGTGGFDYRAMIYPQITQINAEKQKIL